MRRHLILPWLVGLLGVGLWTQADPAAAPEPPLARFWQALADQAVQCQLCPRRCVIAPGQRGVCQVRINRDGKLRTYAYGNPVALNLDPIEKKPFFHVTPGESVLSLAVAGCNMRCLFCQNWSISQAVPDPLTVANMPPQKVVDAAVARGSRFLVYTYTEPTIFYEYMLDIAKAAKARGLYNAMHSCGYINPEPLKELLPYMDAVDIDLKGFTPEFYQKMGALAELQPVLDTLKAVHAAGVWLEITNLVIPGVNDDPEQIRKMCVWIRENCGADTPLHFSRFMPAYKLRNLPPTPVATLEEAWRIATAAGLHYVYIGNVPGNAHENTVCPQCGKTLVRRTGFVTEEVHVKAGTCEYCHARIAGRWDLDATKTADPPHAIAR